MPTRRTLDDWLRVKLDRRTLLGGSLAICGWPAARRLSAAAPTPRWRADPFALGVASGDPTSDGVVLWTRLAPDPLNGGGMPPAPVEVSWIVAADEKLRRVVKRGKATAFAELAHAVHVEVDGLDDDRWYWYQFRAGDAVSRVGRTRTTPKRSAAAARLRFAFASCQHYESGFFTAYRHMAAEDLDLVFHLGDYIYEGAASTAPNRPRLHAGTELMTVDNYRQRYAQYRMDPDLQAAHAMFPWVVTWDDHEVDNNYANDISEHDDPRAAFLSRRAAAYRAHFEHMPLRKLSMPDGPNERLYRPIWYGGLASFFVLDTRQYRTNQPCNDRLSELCDASRDPKATMMGPEQAKWLYESVDKSITRWNVVPQQVQMAPVDRAPGPGQQFYPDHWAGYQVEQRQFMEFLHYRKPSNPVVLTGDIHSNWVNDLKLNFFLEGSPIVGTELVGTSITSGGDGSDRGALPEAVFAENPFVKFYNSQRGYVSCTVTPEHLEAKYQIVPYVTKPDAPLETRATFVVENGRPGAQKA